MQSSSPSKQPILKVVQGGAANSNSLEEKKSDKDFQVLVSLIRRAQRMLLFVGNGVLPRVKPPFPPLTHHTSQLHQTLRRLATHGTLAMAVVQNVGDLLLWEPGIDAACANIPGQHRDELLRRAAKAAAGVDLVLALGSTLSNYPAASIPLLAAFRGIPYAVIHQDTTDHDGHPRVTLRIFGDASQLFPLAVSQALST